MTLTTSLELALPARIAGLSELAYNLWWSWQPEASWLFQNLDQTLWELTQHNPVKLLSQIAPAKLESAATDPVFLRRYDGVMMVFGRYVAARGPGFLPSIPTSRGRRSPTFGRVRPPQLAPDLLRRSRHSRG